MSKIPRFIHFTKNPDWWSDKKFTLDGRPPFAVHVRTGGPELSSSDLKIVAEVVDRISELELEAASLIAQLHYSYEYFLALGVPNRRLVQNPTAENLAAQMTIRSVSVFNFTGPHFEISHDVSWNDYHTYDVNFDTNGSISCAVNDNGLFATDIRESQLCIANRELRHSLSATATAGDVLRQAVTNELYWCGFGQGKPLRGKLIHLHEADGRPAKIAEYRKHPTLQAKPLIKRLSLAFPWSYNDTCKVIDQMISEGIVSLSFNNRLIDSASNV